MTPETYEILRKSPHTFVAMARNASHAVLPECRTESTLAGAMAELRALMYLRGWPARELLIIDKPSGACIAGGLISPEEPSWITTPSEA